MAEREVKLTFKVEDAGGIAMLDAAGRKVAQLGEQSKQAGEQVRQSWSAAGVATTAATAAFTALAAAATAGAAAFGFAMNELRKVGDLSETAQTMGLTVQQLSALSVTAQMAGTSVQTLGVGLNYLSRQIVAQNPYFEQLGIAVKDKVTGEFRNAIDVAKDLSNTFARSADGPEKLAATWELFGRGGREWMKVLNQGSAELERQAQLAQRLGLVFSDELGRRADDLFDTFGVLQSSVQAIGVDIGTALLPELEHAAQATLAWWEANRRLIGQDVAAWASDLATALKAVWPVIETTGRLFGGLADLIARAVAGVVVGQSELATDDVLRRAMQRTGVSRQDLAGMTVYDRTFAERALGEERMRNAPGAMSLLSGGAMSVDPAILDALSMTGGGGTRPRLPAPPVGREAASTGRAAAATREDRAEIEAINAALEARLALLDTDADRRQLAVDLAKEDLQTAEALGATDAERLARMAQIMDLEQRSLEAKRTALVAERDAYADVGVMTAKQVADAAAVQVEIEQVDASLARLPMKMAAFTRQLEQSREVVVNLSQTFGDSMRRAVDGLLASGGTFKIESVAKDTGRVIASEVVGGFIKAQAAKLDFDELMIGNFGVSLPKAIADGARKIGEVFTSLFDSLGGNADKATTGLVSGFTGAFGQIAGQSAQLGQVVAGNLGGTMTYTDAFGNRYSGAGSSVQGAIGVPGGVGTYPQAPGFWGQAMGAVSGAATGIGTGFMLSSLLGGGTAGNVIGGLAGGALGGALIGMAIPVVGPLLGALLGGAVGGLGGGIASLFSSTPTRENERLDAIDEFWTRMGIPRKGQLEDSVWGREPGRIFGEGSGGTPGLAMYVQRAVDTGLATLVPKGVYQAPYTSYGGSLVSGARGVGAAWAVGAGQGWDAASDFANAFVTNAAAFNWSAEYATKQLRNMAEAAGIDLPEAIAALNTQLAEGGMNATRYSESINATVALLGGDMSQTVRDAAVAMATVWNGSRTVLDAATFQEAAGTLGTFESRQQALQASAAQQQRAMLNPRARRGAIEALIAGLDPQFEALRAGGITAEELPQWQKLLTQREAYVSEFQLTASTRASQQRAIELTQGTAALYGEPAATAWAPGLGLDQQGVRAAITEAYGPLNTSIEELNKAIDRQTFYLERYLNDPEHWSARDERIYENVGRKIDQLRESIDAAAAAIPAAVNRWAEEVNVAAPVVPVVPTAPPTLPVYTEHSSAMTTAPRGADTPDLVTALRENTEAMRLHPVQVHINVDGAQLSGDGRTLADFIGKATVDAMRNDLRVRAEVKRIAVSKS